MTSEQHFLAAVGMGGACDDVSADACDGHSPLARSAATAIPALVLLLLLEGGDEDDDEDGVLGVHYCLDSGR